MLLTAKSLDFSKRKSPHANTPGFMKLCFAALYMAEILLQQFIEFFFFCFCRKKKKKEKMHAHGLKVIHLYCLLPE